MYDVPAWPPATPFLEQIAGAGRVTACDAECVGDVRDYETVLDGLLREISEGALALTHFTGSEGPRRLLTIAINGSAPHSFEVEGRTDWMDHPAVVAAVNRILASIGHERQLVQYHGPEFGQEAGWALLTPAELAALLRFGLAKNRLMTLCYGEGKCLGPVSEDYGGDGGEAWEQALSMIPHREP
jgi:hypothetical protein